VSKTASGKTLSFILPILNLYAQEKNGFSCFFLYPTKALSRDQEGTLSKLLKTVSPKQVIGTFDGDTPREERSHLQKNADFILSNPDMLHAGILPNHNRKWRNFLGRLKFIVIDEVHTYRGAYGSHVANVLKRLLRVCKEHGSDPVFVCCSATIGNPKEHVENLCGKDFELIENDSSPQPPREIYTVNPALVKSHGETLYRKGTKSVSIHLLRKATELGIRTICFCRARQEVERLYRAVVDGNQAIKDKVKPYRGGLLPNERRKLERDLANGTINTVISTNALELGIDIGDLELAILSGHPGTIASFWQQAGRVGRAGKKSIIIYVAKNTSIDQYLVHHPEFIINKPVEEAWLSANNPYILIQHLPCAAYEYPLKKEDSHYSGLHYQETLEVLAEDNTLVPYRDSFRYGLEDYPSKGVNIRGMTDWNIQIICDGKVIGELDPIGARGTLYKDAIYQHLGQKYMSLDLNLDQKTCTVTRVDVDYFTEAVWHGNVDHTEIIEEKLEGGSDLKFGFVHVNKQPKLYKKIKEKSFENIGYGPITLDPFKYDTTGFSFLAPKKWVQAIEKQDSRLVGSALFGLSFLLRQVAPSFCMADRRDMDSDVSLANFDEELWKSALYVFDSLEGGVGYSEKVYERIKEVMALCYNILTECECSAGCPACVPPLPPGVEDEELESFLIQSNAAVKATESFLIFFLKAKLVSPRITSFEEKIKRNDQVIPEDKNKIKRKKILSMASKIMDKKRKRIH